jgi:hypothetical protein
MGQHVANVLYQNPTQTKLERGTLGNGDGTRLATRTRHHSPLRVDRVDSPAYHHDAEGEVDMNFPLDKLLSQQTNIGHSRSSILNPLQWMTVIIVGGLASFVFAHAPNWLIILMAVLLSSTFALFAGGFIYFMIREPGTLRSEIYALLKGALDKGYFTAEVVAQLAGQENKIRQGQEFEVRNARDLRETVHRRRGNPS